MRLTHEKRHFLFGRAAVRSPLPLSHLRRAACAFPLAGVRAPCGRARPATQSALRAVCPIFRRLNIADDVALPRDENYLT